MGQVGGQPWGRLWGRELSVPPAQAQFEMPYVVRLHNFHQLAPPQPCFSFQHPNPGEGGGGGDIVSHAHNGDIIGHAPGRAGPHWLRPQWGGA